MKHFLSITDITAQEIMTILKKAVQQKNELKTKGKNKHLLQNQSLVMLFEKPSLRTRLSFEIGMTQLGGHGVYLAPADIGLGKRECISDVAHVISSMGNILMARTFAHQTVVDLANNATIPVINGLSDLEHPCQTLADLLTIYENKQSLQNLSVAFIGDADNNVVHSLALASEMLKIKLSIAAPQSYWMNKKISKQTPSVFQTTDPKEAIEHADIVYTDTWVSMGDEAEKEQRMQIFKPYQVTKELMKLAKHDAIFMHDMPAYRGNEVTDDVIDGPQSVIFQQAENRLHAQKSLMCFLTQKHHHQFDRKLKQIYNTVV